MSANNIQEPRFEAGSGTGTPISDKLQGGGGGRLDIADGGFGSRPLTKLRFSVHLGICGRSK